MVLGPQARLAPRTDHRVVTNSERADQLLADAEAIAGELRSALALRRWNLAVRRAQEIIELVAKGLINEMGVEYPRTHDPVPALIDTIRQRGVDADQAFLDWLRSLSRELADLRGPAFYQEIADEHIDIGDAGKGKVQHVVTKALAENAFRFVGRQQSESLCRDP